MDSISSEPVQEAAIPVHTFSRDLQTGLINGMVYPTRADGRIDWLKLIPKDQIVFNTSPKLTETIEKAYGKPANSLVYAELVDKGVEVNPKHILILLTGFTELAAIRGGSFKGRIAHALSYPPEAAISICECNIDWIPNVEEPDGFSSYGTADATMDNTGGWGYLSAMAGNRAFVRAVKQGLRIPVLGFDEIAKKDTQIPESNGSTSYVASGSTTSPSGMLEKCAVEMGINFESVKNGAISKYRQKIEGDPQLWTAWSDVSPRDCWTLIDIIKTPKKKA